MLSRLASLLAILALSACSVNTYKIGAETFTPENLPKTMTRPYGLTEALLDLGPPNRMSATPTGYAMAWEHWYIRQDKLGISLRPIGVEFLSFDWGGARTEGQFLLMVFDHDHRLVASGYNEWDNEVGGGRALQPLISFVDVVDVSDLTVPMPHHLWGGYSLSPLPVALNVDSHLDTGQNGIQQRGTPVSIGQHTLETRR